jgi:LAS superfamily LD-carboxypeptidase LdcB
VPNLLDDTEIEFVVSTLNKFQDNLSLFELPFLLFDELFSILTTKEKQFIEQICSNDVEVLSDSEMHGLDARAFIVPVDDVYSKRFIRISNDMARALEEMKRSVLEATQEELYIESGFRSPAYQSLILLRETYDACFDLEIALKKVKRPGHSEHGFRLNHAIDIGITSPKQVLFAKTNAYHWMTTHAAAYGFVQSYPEDNSEGIIYEPWHWKYNS